MTILLIALVLLSFGLALLLGLLSVLRDLFDQHWQGEPVLHDPGPIFHDQVADYRQARSQFAWQSRSHFRGLD